MAEAERVASWSDGVWTTARSGESERTLELLRELPAAATAPELAGLRSAVERYAANMDNREAQRAERTAELRGELEDHADGGDLVEALDAVVELDMLGGQTGAVLSEPVVRRVIVEARSAAQAAERASDWLEAYALVSRLHLLHEDSGEYKVAERRLLDRLQMLRMYVPERFHAMRSDRREAEGEDPLPPYNGLNEDWREKWEGINGRMVVQALRYASMRHVERAPVWEMLAGGLDRVRTLLTTEDLRAALPELRDRGAAAQLVAEIDQLEAIIEQRGDNAGPEDIQLMVSRLERANKRTVRLPEEAVLHEFGTGAAAALDEFSSFYWPDELEAFSRTAQGKFTGVGIQISLNDDLELYVVTPVFGTPAYKAGMKSGDVIREIDGHSATGMNLTQAVQTIVGPEGTGVTLTVEREGEPEPIDFELLRDVIPLHSVKGWERTGPREDAWDYFIDPESRIGYVRLTQFINGTARDLRRAIRSMQADGLDGLVLDLRFNGGGLLDEAVDVANLWIDSGVIVSQEDAMGRRSDEERALRGRSVADGLPTVVLVNGTSASASEIVAGALQDYGKALVVGDRTFGKGSVQNVFMLSGGAAAFKLTTQYYKLPDGRLIHRKEGARVWGVEPDVSVEMLPEQVGDALVLRQDADVVEFDESGRPIADPERPEPEELIEEGIDPQLETAVLLLKSRVVADNHVRHAGLR